LFPADVSLVPRRIIRQASFKESGKVGRRDLEDPPSNLRIPGVLLTRVISIDDQLSIVNSLGKLMGLPL
jgi:hypothetical protein